MHEKKLMSQKRALKPLITCQIFISLDNSDKHMRVQSIYSVINRVYLYMDRVAFANDLPVLCPDNISCPGETLPFRCLSEASLCNDFSNCLDNRDESDSSLICKFALIHY